MSGATYLAGVLADIAVPDDTKEAMQAKRAEVEKVLRDRFGSGPRIYYAGSYKKWTMIKASSDLDIVMYVPATDNRTLKSLYQETHQALVSGGLTVTKKNVALKIYDNSGGFHVDVVPGRALDDTFVDANLYQSEADTSRKTSIKKHIEHIRQSTAREIIKLAKQWRRNHNMSWFSSFALELSVVKALNGKSTTPVDSAFLALLDYWRDYAGSMRLVDPANSNNCIDMSTSERYLLAAQAKASRGQKNWEDVVWTP